MIEKRKYDMKSKLKIRRKQEIRERKTRKIREENKTNTPGKSKYKIRQEKKEDPKGI